MRNCFILVLLILPLLGACHQLKGTYDWDNDVSGGSIVIKTVPDSTIKNPDTDAVLSPNSGMAIPENDAERETSGGF